MRNFFTATFMIALVAMLVTTPAWAKTHAFKLAVEATVNGTQLAPDTYELKLSSNPAHEATIHRKGKVMAKTRVKLRPLNPRAEAKNSVLVDTDGTLREIRLKKEVVVFIR